MIERKIDYRGSKSIIFVGTHLICVTVKSIVVKEQRVYGSWRENYNTIPAPSCFFPIFLLKKNWSCFSRLRCTLMGFERNYKIRIHYNQICIQERLFYSKVQESSLIETPTKFIFQLGGINPLFITGFTSEPIKQNFIRQYRKKAAVLQLMSHSTSLVLWGQNLTCTVGEKYTRAELAMVKLPINVRGVIVGLILSDGWLRFSNKRSTNALLGFKQSLIHFEYIWFVFRLLSHYCSSYPSLKRGGTRRGKETIDWEFFTRSMPCITELYSLFYPNKVKVIPSNIYELLAPIALAHLVMGDGNASRHGLVLCTDSYKLIDVIRLMNVLIIKYRLECTLRFHTSTQPRIYIREQSMPWLRQIIKPYMCSSMLYKIKL